VATHPRLLIGSLTAIAALAAVMLVVAVTNLNKTSNGPDVAAQTGEGPFEGGTMPPGVRAPSFALLDQDGKPVTMAQYLGKPVIVTYLYSHCTDTCPITAQMVRGALDDLGHDVPALAISVDPFRDTPASARAFLRRQHVTGRIRFVLGKRRQLLPVWRGFAIAPQLPQTEHQAWITLVDKRGFQRVGSPVNQTSPEHLAHDVRVLERERG
jgi:protein SCO1/2